MFVPCDMSLNVVPDDCEYLGGLIMVEDNGAIERIGWRHRALSILNAMILENITHSKWSKLVFWPDRIVSW